MVIVLFAYLFQGTIVYMRYVFVLNDFHHPPMDTSRDSRSDCSIRGERNIKENVGIRAIFEAMKYWERLLLE